MENNKIYLDKMTAEQLTRVYNACQAVREGMFDYCLDMYRDMVFGELKYHFRDCIDVTEDAWSNIGIRVNDPIDFILKLTNSDFFYCIDDQKTKDLHAELISKIDEYKNAAENNDDEREVAFCAWYIDHVDRVAYALRSYYQDILDAAYNDDDTRAVFTDICTDGGEVTIGHDTAPADEFYIIGDNYGTLYRDTVLIYK